MYALRYLPRPSQGLFTLAIGELADGRVGDIVRRSDLSRPQGEVVSLWLGGCTFQEVGIIRGTSKQAAHMHWAHAVGKLRDSYDSDPYAGLVEAYGELVGPRFKGDFYRENS